MDTIEDMLGKAQEQAKAVAAEVGRYKHARAQVAKYPKSAAALKWERQRGYALGQASKNLQRTINQIDHELLKENNQRVVEANS